MALRDILTHIRSRLSQNRKLYVQSEAAVRYQLIAPVLKELGWDTTNPDRVRPEYTVGKNRVDWALFKGDRPVLFIEAKTVTTLDEASTVQLGNYCYQESVEFGVITNGKIWRFLKTYEPGKSVQERVFWDGDVEQDVNRVLTGLTQISYDNVDQIERFYHRCIVEREASNIQLNDILKLIYNLLSDPLRQSVSFEECKGWLIEILRSSLEKKPEKIEKPPMVLKEPVKPKSEKKEGERWWEIDWKKNIPSFMLFEDKEYSLKHATDAWRIFARILIERGYIGLDHLPFIFPGSKKRLIINHTKDMLTVPENLTIGNFSVYIEKFFTANEIKVLIYRLCENFGLLDRIDFRWSSEGN